MMSSSTIKLGETTIILPAAISWVTPQGAPEESYENAFLAGNSVSPGPYFAVMRWHPGYMSAPHTYSSDRLAYVLSGIWWIGDGADYDPGKCRPVPAGTFIHRPAGTAHYDGVVSGAASPAVIAVSGLAPLNLQFTDTDGLPLRRA